MAQFTPNFKIHILIFSTLVLALVVFGQAQDVYEYEELEPATTTRATTTTQKPRTSTTSRRPVRGQQSRIEEMLNERDLALNRTLERLERNIQTILSAVQSPAPPGGNNNNNNNNVRDQGGISGRSVQVNSERIRRLENEIKALRNLTSSAALNNNNNNNNQDDDDDDEEAAVLHTELHDLRYRIDTLNSSLGNQNLENAQRVHRNLANLTQEVIVLLETEREKKRQRIVRELLQAFTVGQNQDVKDRLDELAVDNLLSFSMTEIVRRMFAGNINNYGRIISLFQSIPSTKREQYKSGLNSLVDVFHNKVGNSSSSSGSSGSSATNTFVDEPKYLNLVYLVKKEFGNEFLSKFNNLVQNLAFKPKICIRNLYTNSYLFVDREEGLKEDGYSVSIRGKSAASSAGFCDWEILSLSEGASFNIRQRNPGELLNLHVLAKKVFAGTDAFNPHHLWKIQLKKNAQGMTLQSIPGSSDNPSYYLCSSKSGGKSRRPVEVKENPGEGLSCYWFIDG